MGHTLIVVRHAKSSWAEQFLSDHDRPLNKRGFRDAPRMGKRLARLGYSPEVVLTSSALRARTTAELVAAEMDVDPSVIDIRGDLYGSMPGDMLRAVEILDTDIETAMLVAHNPGITALVNFLGDTDLSNVPTCGVAVLEAVSGGWRRFSDGGVDLLHYDFPKNSTDS